jgi:hypothetical protein
MRRLLTVLSITTMALIVSTAISAQSSENDPRIGTWKLDTAKSKDHAPRRSDTRTYTQSGDSLTAHIEIVNSDGSTQIYGYTAKSDGKDYPWTGQVPTGAETVSMKRIGNTFISESKKGGKLLFTTTATFSAEGKVMTLTTKGTDADGKPIDIVRVYDKQ